MIVIIIVIVVVVVVVVVVVIIKQIIIIIMLMTGMASSGAVARLKQDYMRIKHDPLPYIVAEPLPSDIFEWYLPLMCSAFLHEILLCVWLSGYCTKLFFYRVQQ